MLNFKQKLTKITTLMFDVDGVMTDGKVLVMENGETVRNVNSKDGYALHLAREKQYRIAVISGGNNVAVKNLLNKTGITDVFINQRDKLACYLEYVKVNNLVDEEVLFIGDDLPDYEIMSRVGVAACPKDAATEIKHICQYVSGKNGGEGCVRDIIEQVLRVQNNWEIVGW
ncbi:MAG: HAD hydrolase family protein [Bacteroidota bacterium]|nr:HAD hydrolase family protein [Bacteroidota bacterium]MDP3144150.1 HAD hydrolase family protein [Bacteroidota bacterium]MDP3558255.1 HAD hydrolase family protein [Bacteroidota bacterium]